MELDVTDEEQLSTLADRVGEHLDGLDGVLHSVANAPANCLDGGFLTAPWRDVSAALHTSTYSLVALAMACRPLLRPGSSVVGVDFDASRAWPGYDWMGVAKAGLEACSRYLARDLGGQGIRANLVAAGPCAPWPRAVSAVTARPSRRAGRPAPRSAGIRRTPNPSPVRVWRCSRTGCPPPPARSCTRTAVTT